MLMFITKYHRISGPVEPVATDYSWTVNSRRNHSCCLCPTHVTHWKKGESFRWLMFQSSL